MFRNNILFSWFHVLGMEKKRETGFWDIGISERTTSIHIRPRSPGKVEHNKQGVTLFSNYESDY
jgi:hypothetical protein